MKMFKKLKQTLFNDFPNFIRNIWKFRKALWNHHWWDYAGVLQFIETGVTDIAINIEKKGTEIPESRNKKVAKMQRVIEILKNIREDRYFDIVERELGRKYDFKLDFLENKNDSTAYNITNEISDEQREFNNKFFDRVRKLEESEWHELWDILKGPKYGNYDPSKDWNEEYDGSGINSWWD